MIKKKQKKPNWVIYIPDRSYAVGEGVGVGWPGVKVCPGMNCETVDPLMS